MPARKLKQLVGSAENLIMTESCAACPVRNKGDWAPEFRDGLAPSAAPCNRPAVPQSHSNPRAK